MRERKQTAFTLIELLTVVAIIALLISILVPALNKARIQARQGASRSVIKTLSDGLDMFRVDNPEECRSGEGYPSSSMRDDPTEQDEGAIFGAQWLVRYLMGKQEVSSIEATAASNFEGYIPRRNVPRGILYDDDATEYWQEAHWYEKDYWPDKKMDTAGLYVSSESAVIRPTELTGYAAFADSDSIYEAESAAMKAPVFKDYFDYPILYYAANTAVYRRYKSSAAVACYMDWVAESGDPNEPAPEQKLGIYAHSDNGIFTGLSIGGTDDFAEWPLVGVKLSDKSLMNFGEWTNELPTEPGEFVDSGRDNMNTFPYYILNKTVFESTKQNGDDGVKASVVPYRPDSFLLISPGHDGVYGTPDDINNFAP